MSKDEIAAIIEYFDDKFAQFSESFESILMSTNKIPAIEADLKIVKDDVKTIKKAVKDTNTDLKLLERRVAKLENA
jgi:polyhydroxyalkanoate synthesis regulator phasin